jgi:hypothetical protein
MHVQAADFDSWVKDAVKKQEARALHEEPAFTVAELQTRFEAVHVAFTTLSSVPAPKPPVVAKNETESTTGEAEKKSKDESKEKIEGGQDKGGGVDAETNASVEENVRDEL